MEPVVCTDCDGKGKVFAFVDGHTPDGKPFSRNGMYPCSRCQGSGLLTAERSRRIQIGKQWREWRMEAEYTLREAAQRRGITPSELSKIERGDGPDEYYAEPPTSSV